METLREIVYHIDALEPSIPRLIAYLGLLIGFSFFFFFSRFVNAIEKIALGLMMCLSLVILSGMESESEETLGLIIGICLMITLLFSDLVNAIDKIALGLIMCLSLVILSGMESESKETLGLIIGICFIITRFICILFAAKNT